MAKFAWTITFLEDTRNHTKDIAAGGTRAPISYSFRGPYLKHLDDDSPSLNASFILLDVTSYLAGWNIVT